MSAAKIRKGDKVVVLSGRDKGKTGEVISSLPKESKVVVSGVNVATRPDWRDRNTSADLFYNPIVFCGFLAKRAKALRLVLFSRLDHCRLGPLGAAAK